VALKTALGVGHAQPSADKTLYKRAAVIRLFRNTALITILFAAVFLASTFIRMSADGPSLASLGGIAVESFRPAAPSDLSPQAILLNNLPVMLVTIIPQPNGVATVLLFAFKAGVTFSFLGAQHGVSGTEGALVAMSKPFFWFEIVAYCLVAAQSIELGRKLSPGGYRALFKRAIKELSQLGKKKGSISWRSVQSNILKMYMKVRKLIPSTIVVLLAGAFLLTVGAQLEAQEIASLTRR
jgi:hypothetical protein